METEQTGNAPARCPVCQGELLITHLQCAACGTEVNGAFTLSKLASLPDPHASLIEMFLRVRGNMKEMERDLGLSYPTVRARLEEALTAAGFPKERQGDETADWSERFEAELTERIRARVEERLASIDLTARRADDEAVLRDQRRAILDRLERGEVTADEAADLLRQLKKGRNR